jgi:CheY-like chemotaxis protein
VAPSRKNSPTERRDLVPSKAVFTKNLKDLMEKKKLIAADLVRDLKVSPSGVSKWMNGEAIPGDKVLDKMRQLYGWRLNNLWNEDDATTKSQGTHPPSLSEAMRVVEDHVKELRKAVSNRKPGVMIVDDDSFMQTELHKALVEAGFLVFECHDGKEAIEELNSLPPGTIDAVISDNHMPNLSGTKLLIHLREHHPNILRVSASGSVLSTTDLEKMKVDLHMPKPFRLADLVSAVVDLVEKRKHLILKKKPG